jgi:hypothetical protein
MRRVNLLILTALLVGLALPLLQSSPAHASLSGPCFVTASVSGNDGGTFETINPQAKTGVYTVPITGSANYDGGINVSVPEEGRPISGSVSVSLPFGTSVSIKSWSDDDAKSTGDKGSVTWDLPDATPRGIEMTVSGSHSDIQGCSGSISVRLDGGLLDSVAGVATTVATAVTGLLALLTGIPPKP